MPSTFNWSPGIGDPSFGGWLTVVLYFGAAFLSYRAAGYASKTGAARTEVLLWYLLTIGLVLLGINKQLDLQSALTELGRHLAHSYGWYEARRAVQVVFVFGLLVLAIIFAVGILIATVKMPTPTRLAIWGALFVVAFVLVRASSFHLVDQLIVTRILGLNWILEMGGLLIIQAAAIWRVRPGLTATRETNR